MSFESIIASIDAELAKLQQAKSVLSVLTTTMAASVGTPSAPARRKPGRPKKSVSTVATGKPVVAATAPAKKKKRRKLSPEARKRIREAALARWAKIKAGK